MTSGKPAGTHLHIHRSPAAGTLVAALADLLATPLADPFTAEIVAVPTRGIERWLAQRLSHRLGADSGQQDDGVCANVLFPHPNDILDDAIAAASPEHSTAVDLWQPAKTVWHLVARLDEFTTSNDDRFALLRHHLTTKQDIPTGRRYALARRIAGLFDEYASARPDLIQQWARSNDSDDDIPDDLAWQPILWRALRADLGPVPAELLADGLEAIRSNPDRVALPERVSLYGPTRIDATRLQILAALAAAGRLAGTVTRPTDHLQPAPCPGRAAVRGTGGVLANILGGRLALLRTRPRLQGTGTPGSRAGDQRVP